MPKMWICPSVFKIIIEEKIASLKLHRKFVLLSTMIKINTVNMNLQ